MPLCAAAEQPGRKRGGCDDAGEFEEFERHGAMDETIDGRVSEQRPGSRGLEQPTAG